MNNKALESCWHEIQLTAVCQPGVSGSHLQEIASISEQEAGIHQQGMG